jgi:histidinol-phosphatase (PHP family)
MITTDFHLHTNLSVDSTEEPFAIVQSAIDKGLTEIALTDHADYNPNDGGFGFYHPETAWKRTKEAQDKFHNSIIIRHGVEIGETHLFEKEISYIHQIPFDLVIGSIHFMETNGVHSDLFDVYPPQEGIRKYFDFMIDMATSGEMDILGHFDYFDRYTTQRGYPQYNPDDFASQIDKILQTIIKRDIAMELNTSGWRSSANRPFPHPKILQKYFDLNGKLLCIGSDAHCKEHVGLFFDKAQELLLSIGFTEYHIFHNRSPISRPII